MRSLLFPLTICICFAWSCKSSQAPVKTEDDSDVATAKAEEKPAPSWAPKTHYPYQGSATREHDLIHTRLEVSFDWEKSYLYGKANLTLKPWFHATSKLSLDAKGMEFKGIKMATPTGKKDLEYKYDGMKLDIELNKKYTREEKFEVEIDYVAKPDELEVEGSSAITDAKGLYFINPKGEEPNKPRQIWTQGETEASSCWFPTIDKPNENTTQEIYITVDSNFTTLSNGLLLESKDNGDGTRTDYWKQSLAHAPYLFMMAIGEYKIVTDKWRGMDVSYYVEPKYEPHARAIFGNTPEMLEHFSTQLGVDYPWEKYAQVVVRDYVSGAMENTTATVHGEFLNRTTRELMDGNNEGVIAHELFHHWFGDLVTCESWSNLPLNESFATYGEYLWNEYKYGRDFADMRFEGNLKAYLGASTRKREYLIRFHYHHREDMFDTHSYQKGSRVLHMLRKVVGDDAFFASLKYYLEQNAHSDVEIHELRLAFEEVTGKDMNWFFNQWFLSPGHPELKVSYDYDSAKSEVMINVKQNQDLEYMPIYQLPIEIEAVADNTPMRHSFWMSTVDTTFRFPSSYMPENMIMDPDDVLLASISEKKSKPMWLVQLQTAESYMQIKEAEEKLAFDLDDAKVVDAMIKLLGHEFYAVRSMTLNKLANYKGERAAEVLDIASKLANNDPKPNVRWTAIEYLANQKPAESADGEAAGGPDKQKVLQVFKNAASDSSFNVLSKSLSAYYDWEPEGAIELAEKMETQESDDIKVSVAKIYMESNHAKALPYTSSLLSEMRDGFGKFSLITSFAKWIDGQEAEKKKEGFDVLQGIADGSGAWWVRMSAVRALLERKSNEGVTEFLEGLSEKESNKMLKRMLDEGLSE